MAAAIEARVEPQKLEKKVAQLTKVVVFLNKRNEESQRERGLLAQQHEDEVQTIISHARGRLERLEQKVAEIGPPELVLDALTAKLRTVAQARADEEVARVRQSGQQQERHYVTGLQARTAELDAVRKQAAAMQQRIAEAVEKAGDVAARQTAAIVADHQAEVTRLKAGEAQLQTKVQNLEERCATLHDRAESAEAAEVELRATEAKLAEACLAEEALKAKVAEERARATARDSDLLNASARVAELEGQLASVSSVAETRANESSKLMSMLDEAKAANFALEEEHTRRISEHDQRMSTHLAEREQLKLELENKIKAAAAEEERLRFELTEKDRRHSEVVNRLENTLHTTRTSTSAAASDAEKQMAGLRAKLEKELREAVSAAQKMEKDLKASHAKDVDSLQQRHSVQLREFRNAWDRDRQVMVEQHKAELAAAVGSSSSAAVDVQLANEEVSRLEHEVRVATARCAELETALSAAKNVASVATSRGDKLEEDLAARILEIESLRKAQNASSTVLQQELQAARTKMEATALQVQQLTADLASSRAALARAEASEQRHHAARAAEVKRLEEEHNKTRTSMQATVSELHEKLRQSSTQLKLGSEEAEEREQRKLAELEQRLLQEAKEREEQRVASALSEHAHAAHAMEQAAIAATQEKMEKECAARNSEIAALQKALQDARAECETDISNAKAEAAERLQRELTDATARAAIAAEELKAAHDAELKRIRAEADESIRAAHALKKDELAAQEHALQKRHESVVHETRRSLLSEAKAESARLLASAEEAHNAALASLRAAITAAQEAATASAQARDAAISRVDALEGQMAEQEDKIRELGKALEGKGNELLSQRRETSAELEKARTDANALVDQHKTEMEKLISRYSSQIDELKEDLARTQAMSAAKLAVFEEEFRNAEIEFANRQSLPADIERISELEGKLAETLKKTQQLAKLNKQYALEVRQQDTTMHVMLKGDAPTLATQKVLPRVGGKATLKRHGPRGSGLPK
eukprot:m.127440 g.127440  ORF g.127440 m.127440 type:complete len:1003 (-) comp13600_c0_seq1:256-3264(-)